MPTNPPVVLSGSSPALRSALESAEQFAAAPAAVLILGERGTGKTTIARYIHQRSGRSGAFIPFSAASRSNGLVLGDLFGHVRGAFTGASGSRPGLPESAQDGTLLIDELGEASAKLQAALLAFFDPEAVRRIGDDRSRPVQCRLMFATNADLHRAAAEGRFRPDLLDRIGYFSFRMPPVRERKADLPILFDRFLREELERSNRGGAEIAVDPRVYELLDAFHWPGNVRQVQQVAHFAAWKAGPGRTLSLTDLPPDFLAETGVRPGQEASAAYSVATAALRAAGGNQSQAARDLHVSRSTFRRMLAREARLRGPASGQNWPTKPDHLTRPGEP